MFELLLKAVGGQLSAGDVERLREELAGVERAVSRSNAQAQGGNSQAAKFDKLIVTGDVDLAAGVVNVGPYAKGKGNARLAAGGLQLRNYATVKVDLQSDGDIFIGSDVGAPGSTYFSIFSNIETYNGEAFLAGDMLIGDNSASKANIKWDKANGALVFRGGTARTITIDTSGLFNLENTVYLWWKDASGNQFKGLVGYDASNVLVLENRTAGGAVKLTIKLTDASVPDLSWDEDPAQVNRTQLTVNGGVQGSKLVLTDSTALADTVIQTAGGSGGTTQATFPGAVNVGTGSSTTAGELTVSGSATIATGISIGTAAAAGVGQILATGTNALSMNIIVDGADKVAQHAVYSNSATPNRLTFITARGTLGTPAASAANDQLFGLRIEGYQTTTGAFGGHNAAMRYIADEAWTNVAQGTRWEHYSTADGATGLTLGLTLGPGAKIGFQGSAAVAQQTSGANLTNNVTAGGTNDTIANYTDLALYTNDSVAIRNNIYQLSRKLKQVNDALRLYGLLT